MQADLYQSATKLWQMAAECSTSYKQEALIQWEVPASTSTILCKIVAQPVAYMHIKAYSCNKPHQSNELQTDYNTCKHVQHMRPKDEHA